MAAALAPALPIPQVTAARAAAPAGAARFWGVYMARLHGDVSPGMISTFARIGEAEAAAVRSQLVASRAIVPTGFVRASANVPATQPPALPDLDEAVDYLDALVEPDEDEAGAEREH